MAKLPSLKTESVIAYYICINVVFCTCTLMYKELLFVEHYYMYRLSLINITSHHCML